MLAALATFALWLAGDPRIAWRTLAVAAPVSLGDAPTARVDGNRAFASLDGAETRAQARFDAPLPAEVASALARGDAVYIDADVSVRPEDGTAPDARATAMARRALSTLDAYAGDERLARDVFGLVSTRGHSEGSGILRLPPDTGRVRLRFVVYGGAGAYRFTAEPVRFLARPAGHAWWMGAIGAAWVGLGLALLVWCVRRVGAASVLAGAAAVGVVLVGVSLSESAPWPNSAWLLAELARPFPALAGVDSTLVFKTGHFGAFLLVGAAVWTLRPRPAVGAAEAAAFVLMLALASESLQRHLVDRTASLRDVIIDLSGAACGVVLAAGVLWVVRRSMPADRSKRRARSASARARPRTERLKE